MMDTRTMIAEIARGDDIRLSSGPTPEHMARASSWGDPCTRYLWLSKHRWQAAGDIKPSTGAIFWLGRALEGHIATRVAHALTVAGCTSMEVHHFPPRHHHITVSAGNGDDPVQVGVSLDRTIHECEAGIHTALEIKTMHDGLVDQLDCESQDGWRALLDAPQQWLRRYPAQVMAYTLALQEDAGAARVNEVGMLAVLGKASGRLRCMAIPLDEPTIHAAARRALTVQRCESSEDIDALPNGGRIPYQHSVCGRCRFRIECRPEIAGPQIEIATDPRLMALLHRRRALLAQIPAVAVKELEEVTDEIKTLARAGGGPGTWVTADSEFQVLVQKCAMRKIYEVPKDIQQQYFMGDRPNAAVVRIVDLKEQHHDSETEN